MRTAVSSGQRRASWRSSEGSRSCSELISRATWTWPQLSKESTCVLRASACLQDTLPDSVVAKRIKKVPQLHLPCESWKLPSFFLLRIRHPKIARSLPTCQHSSQAASGRPLFLWSGAPALRRRAPRAVLDSSINASAVPCGGGALLGSTTRHLHSLQGRTLCVLHRVEPMKEDLTMSFVYIYIYGFSFLISFTQVRIPSSPCKPSICFRQQSML